MQNHTSRLKRSVAEKRREIYYGMEWRILSFRKQEEYQHIPYTTHQRHYAMALGRTMKLFDTRLHPQYRI